jgi:hypothetical protein
LCSAAISSALGRRRRWLMPPDALAGLGADLVLVDRLALAEGAAQPLISR